MEINKQVRCCTGLRYRLVIYRQSKNIGLSWSNSIVSENVFMPGLTLFTWIFLLPRQNITFSIVDSCTSLKALCYFDKPRLQAIHSCLFRFIRTNSLNRSISSNSSFVQLGFLRCFSFFFVICNK